MEKKKEGRNSDPLSLVRREDVTRTRDPYVPNVVRYQLRYFSKKEARLSELVDE